MKRNIKKTIFFGVCLGLILIVIQKVFQIDEYTFMHSYWIATPSVVLIAVLVNVFYNISYQKKMNTAVLLLNAGKTEEYIAEIETLIKRAKGRNLNNVLKLNLATGYIDAKQFDVAIKILEELSSERLYGAVVKMVHSLNLCMSYFYAKQFDKAMELYNASQKQFEPFTKNKMYGGHIVEVDILAAISNEQYTQAEKLLDIAQKEWSDPRLQNAFEDIRKILIERKGEN